MRENRLPNRKAKQTGAGENKKSDRVAVSKCKRRQKEESQEKRMKIILKF